MSATRRQLALLLSCVFLSGAVALVHEIAWIRKASLALGATTPALATLLATFFAGLALGGEVFGRLSARLQRPLRAYAWLEAGAGLLAASTPFTFSLIDGLYGPVYDALHGNSLALSAVRVVFVAALVLPPAFLLGGTLPLVLRQLASERRTLGRWVGGLYALNTLGAVVGCVLAGFVLVPTIGVNASIWCGAAVQVLIAAAVFSLPLTAPESQPERADAPPRGSARSNAVATSDAADATISRPAVLGMLVALTGFVSLGGEVLWTRFLSLLVRNTVHTYTLTLGVVLVGIVAGSAIASTWLDRSQRRAAAFGALQVVSALLVLLVLLLPLTFWLGTFDARAPAGRLGIAALVLLGPAVLMGISFPLAVRMLVNLPARAGLGLGRITLVNTAGGILGSLGVGFVALPLLGLMGSLRLVTGAGLAAGLGAWWLLDRSLSRGVCVGASVVAVVAWLALPSLIDTRLPDDFLGPRDRLLDVHEGLAGHVAVLQKAGGRVLEIDQLWQGESEKNHQILAAHLPMILHDDPRRVLVIGLGTGQAPSRFLMHEELQRLTCVDIEGSLFEVAREYFDGDWLDDPRVESIVDDGRSVVAHLDETWDVISIEVGQTFRPGVASFYTRDFYRLVERRLATGGLISQFVPIGFLDPDDFRTIVATFASVFPRCVLWFNGAELLLVGRVGEERAGSFDWDDARLERLREPTVREDLAYAYWGAAESALHRDAVFLGGFLAGPEEIAAMGEGAAIATDDLPALEYDTAEVADDAEADAVVDLVTRHLASLESLLSAPPPEAFAEAAGAARKANLTDLPSRALCRRAFELHAVGRHEETLPLLEEALLINPRSVRALGLLAYTHARAGRDAEALPLLEVAASLAPNDAMMRRNLGIQLMKAGRPSDALTEFQATLALGLEDADVQLGIGASLAMRGELEASIGPLRRALELEPTNEGARTNLAGALFGTGRFDEAASEYQRLVEGKPDDAGARNDLGIALARAGRSAEAIAAYESALARDPRSAPVHVNLGNQLSGVGRTAEALQHFQTAARLDPGLLEAHVNGATLLQRTGRLAEALVGFDAALQLRPDLAPVHDLRGRVLHGLGQDQEAIAAFEEALRLDPLLSSALTNLAAVQAGRPLPPP